MKTSLEYKEMVQDPQRGLFRRYRVSRHLTPQQQQVVDQIAYHRQLIYFLRCYVNKADIYLSGENKQ